MTAHLPDCEKLNVFLRYVAALTTALACAVGSSAAQAPAAESEDAPAIKLATELREAVARVPVTVQPIYGDQRSGEMIITHFRPEGDGPFPAVIMHHGRSTTNRATPGRWRYLDVVRYWTRRGVAVFVPTRLGYGDTGLEPDPEETGNCGNKRYDVAAEAVAVQSMAAIEFATQQPWVDRQRIIVMGQSMGGFTAIASMARRHAGVIAGINFAGGGGGDPVTRKQDPCSVSRMGNVFAAAGKANGGTTPMLWLYSENDNYWGPSIPRKWHEAYTAAGGKADFVMFPPVSTEGHRLLADGMALWRPVLDRFVAPFGILAPRAEGTPPATSFATLADASKLPLVKTEVRENGYRRFLASDVPRAFAIGPKGEWAFQSGERAIARTLERCAQFAKTPCKLYAVDDSVVWVE